MRSKPPLAALAPGRPREARLLRPFVGERDFEAALLAECDRRRVAISTLSDYREGAFARTPTLLLGYAQLHEAAIPAAVAELAAAIRAAG